MNDIGIKWMIGTFLFFSVCFLIGWVANLLYRRALKEKP